VLAVRDDAADGHRVAEMPVGAQHARRAWLGRNAPAELINRPFIVTTINLHGECTEMYYTLGRPAHGHVMPGWILTSGEPQLTLRLPSGAIKTLGRTARADFIVDAALVSRLHCRLTADRSDQLVVEDLESTNGTRVNGQKIDRAILRTGDTLQVGRVEFQVHAAE
jgi:hypothetical protein